jgi:hypothetical protein
VITFCTETSCDVTIFYEFALKFFLHDKVMDNWTFSNIQSIHYWMFSNIQSIHLNTGHSVIFNQFITGHSVIFNQFITGHSVIFNQFITGHSGIFRWLPYTYSFSKSTKEVFNMQGAWHSSNMLPSMVIINWQPYIARETLIRHLGTHWVAL